MTDRLKQTTAVCTSIVLAFGALAFSVRLSHFPVNTDQHPDETIVAELCMQSIRTSTLTANWDRLSAAQYRRPTYQFSPYTLTQSVIARAAHWTIGWPADVTGHVQLARYCAAAWSALAGVLWFLATRNLTGSNSYALTAQLLFSLSLVHIQNSTYARVEGLLSLIVALTFFAAVRSREQSAWNFVCALCIGASVATKYNAAAVVGWLLAAPLQQIWQSNKSRRSKALQVLGLGASVLAGFAAATPEVLRDPSPLVEGVLYEVNHYGDGEPPHAAYGGWWADGNLLYWPRYLVQIGFGWTFSLLILGYLVQAAFRCSPGQWWLAAAVVSGLLIVTVPSTRFERNFEIALGVCAVGATLFLKSVVDYLASRRPVFSVAIFVVALGGAAAQGTLLAVRFANAIERENVPSTKVNAYVGNVQFLWILVYNEPAPELKRFPVVVVFGFGDPKSQAEQGKWIRFFGRRPDRVVRSEWSEYGYGFSTIDEYHGPATSMVFLNPGTRD